MNLSRHEDTPMPESTAELYHGDGNVRAKMIVPGQNLCGAMIPTLGKTTSIKSNQTERAQLINQYQNISQLKQDILGQGLNVELNEGFELVNADNQLVCLQSVDSAENSPCGKSMTDVESTALVNIRRESIRDVVISDNAIQEALERRLHNNTEMRKPKSSWAFSASINVSITKKSLVDQQLVSSNDMQALCNGSNNKRHLIKQSDGDEVEEEGIEVVPILTTNNFNDSPSAEQAFELNDRVSVFFVDDKRMSIHEID